MFNYMKYIRTANNLIIIFSADLSHSAFQTFLPVSAGYITPFQGRLRCFGESISLGLEAIEEADTELANEQLQHTLLIWD